MAQLGGVIGALSTPFTENGELDLARLRDHVDFLIDNGVHGLVPGGSTGEFAALTLDERKRLHEVVLEHTNGRVPVVPQTGATRTADAVELSRHAGEHGASAVLAVQPFYEPPTRDEVMDYFEAVGRAAGVPVVAYNLPAVTGMNLDRTFYNDLLARTDAVRYVKDTSGSLEQAFDLIFNLGDRLSVFVGWDTLVLPAFAAGSDGTILGAVNFAPKECVRLWELAREGRQAEAHELFRRLWNVLDFLGKEGYAASAKAAAELVGVPLGPPREPYRRLPEHKIKVLTELLERAGLRG
ncbi:dihydrodipicolinate synthase family protein [Pseudonocardia acaciae]|uniref:dihydrodipicolinate synthase family protein n=1 Tax=Pseudonocardia acaciae TaxID=551276 RepID=UPI00049076A8|nr:dihydrodipicolinate synthase family protein [Pseudonocardia acaciae]